MQNLSMIRRAKFSSLFWVIILITVVLFLLTFLVFRENVSAIDQQLNNIRQHGNN